MQVLVLFAFQPPIEEQKRIVDELQERFVSADQVDRLLDIVACLSDRIHKATLKPMLSDITMNPFYSE